MYDKDDLISGGEDSNVFRSNIDQYHAPNRANSAANF